MPFGCVETMELMNVIIILRSYSFPNHGLVSYEGWCHISIVSKAVVLQPSSQKVLFTPVIDHWVS